MELNNDKKSSSTKRQSTKELNGWSPRSKQLPNLTSTVEISTKSQLDLVGISSPVASTRSGRSFKVAPVRLIPLPAEGKGKENLIGTRKVPTFNQETAGTSKFKAKHLTVIVHNRPISEEFVKGAISDNKTQKIAFSNCSFKSITISSPVSINETDNACNSTKSKFKSKLLTARVTEEDIAKQFKKDKSSEGIFKEPVTNQLDRSSSLKKTNMSMYGELTLVRNSDLPSWQELKQHPGSKTFDSNSSDTILLNSSKSSKKSQGSSPSKKKEGFPKESPEKIVRKTSIEQTIAPPETTENEQPHQPPRKLFQRKDAPPVNRAPMLFTKKPATNFFKPTASFNGKQPSVSIANSPSKKIEEIPTNGIQYKEKEENNNDQMNQSKRKISLKKEYFHGEIRGNILKWKMGDFIGSGNFGQVFRAMEVESGKIIAVKVISSTTAANKDLVTSFEVELHILQKLKHKHIVQYLGHEILDNNLHIYLEYMSGGNITNILSKYGALPEKTVKVYAKQILAGLIYLHENKVVHKDIKGANILVDGDGTVKLADFGCASQFEKTLSNFNTFLANSLQGSIPWMAPEVVKETGYGRRSDIWSFGCTILEMATGKLPWSHYQFDNPVAILMKIALSEEIPLIPDTLSDDLKSFLSLCLQRDPSKRPHAQDLIIHPFLTLN